MSLDLVPYAHTSTDRARTWINLHGDELKRRATAAARDKSRDDLWGLAEAYLTTYGSAGAKVSPQTLRTYRASLDTFLNYALEGAVSILKPQRDVGALWLRSMEAEGLSASTVRVKLAGARMLYKALRWSGATDVDPFTDAQPARDKTAPWDKRQPYSEDDLLRG